MGKVGTRGKAGFASGVACSILIALALLPQCISTDGSSGGDAGAPDGDGNASGTGATAGIHQGGGTGQAASGGTSEPSAGTGNGGAAGEPSIGGAPPVAGSATAGTSGSVNGGTGGSDAAGGGGNGGDVNGGDGGGNQGTWPRCEQPPEFCNVYSDCPWYQGCVDQRCVPIAEGAPCSSALDCGMAEYCDDTSQCKNRRIYGAEDCLADPTGICPQGSECYWFGSNGSFENQCVDTSTNTGFCDHGIIPCAGDYYCPTDSGPYAAPPYCVKRAALGEDCIGEEPYSCLPGLSCNFSKCQTADAALGTACEFSVAGFDRTTMREYDVRYTAPCAQGLYCQYIQDGFPWLIAECSALKALGADCSDDFECLDARCVGQKCTAPSAGGRCGYRRGSGGAFVTTVCPDGYTCYGGLCEAPLALGDDCYKSNRPCPEGAICHQGPLNAPYVPNSPYTCVKTASPHQDCADAVCIDNKAVCVQGH